MPNLRIIRRLYSGMCLIQMVKPCLVIFLLKCVSSKFWVKSNDSLSKGFFPVSETGMCRLQESNFSLVSKIQIY